MMLAPSLEADPDGYRWLAESLAVHGVFGTVDANEEPVPTAFRPPAYPWLLSWWVQNDRLTVSAVAWLHGILGVATVGLTFWLARQLFAMRDGPNASESSVSGAIEVTTTVDKRPLLAALFVAVDPILLVQSAQVMTETLATFLAVAAWSSWLWSVSWTTRASERRIAGVALASVLTAAFFCRPAFIIWAILLVGWLVGLWFAGLRAFPETKLLAVLRCLSPLSELERTREHSPDAPLSDPPKGRVKPETISHQPSNGTIGRGSGRGAGGAKSRRYQRDLFLSAGLILLMLGGAIGWWIERNRRAIGHPVWATSHGGYTLLLGNNPVYYDHLRSRRFGRAWQAKPFHHAWSYRYDADPFAEDFWEQHGEQPMVAPVFDDEVGDDRLAYDVAKATIRQQPAMFVWSSIVRVGNLWSPLPRVTDQRSRWQVAAIGAFYLVMTGLVLGGAWSLRWRLLTAPWIAGLLLAIALTAVHAVYWSNLRMRAPAIPWLSLLAAAGMARLMRRHFCLVGFVFSFLYSAAITNPAHFAGPHSG